MKLNILNGFTDWLQKVIDAFKDMEPLELFIIGLGVGIVIIILIYAFVAGHYRRKRLKTHKITINFDGGFYQGSCDELVITAKKGEKVDFTNVVPSKEGYQFNGFNFYKRFVASSITKKGVTKDNITIEKYDGEKKDVIEMPDYDLYLVACYSEVRDDETIKLKSQTYYSDFLTIDDLIAELKHMNEDKETYPDTINIVTSDKEPNLTFIFKELTIVGFLKNVRGITKVFLRTSDEVDDKLLNPFYQAEDINDCYNWYSFVIMYNTKLSRFIRSFEESYKQIDCSHKTTSIEFNMICASLSRLADPVVDRTLMLVEKYEKDRLLDPQPEYVKNRELPPNEEIVEEKEDDLTFEERTSIILKGDVVGQDEEDVSELDEAVMSTDNELTDEKIQQVFGGKVEGEEEEEDFMDRELEVKKDSDDGSVPYLGEEFEKPEEEETLVSETFSDKTAVNDNLGEEVTELKNEEAETTDAAEEEIVEPNEEKTDESKEEVESTEPESTETEVKEDEVQEPEEEEKQASADEIIENIEEEHEKKEKQIEKMFPKLDDPLRYARKVRPAITPLKVKHVDGETVSELAPDDSNKAKEPVKPLTPIRKPSKPVNKFTYDVNAIMEELTKITVAKYEDNDEVVDPNDSLAYDVKEDEKLTDTEKKELEIKRSALNYDREKLIELAMKGNEDKIELVKRKASKNSPYTLKTSNKTYAMIYENRFGLVRVILRLDDDTAKDLSKIHPNIIRSKFPMGFFWYQVYLDDTFYKKSEITWLLDRSRIFAEKLIEQEEEAKKDEE